MVRQLWPKILVCTALFCYVENYPQPNKTADDIYDDSRICGIYCLAIAAEALEMPIALDDVRQLLLPKLAINGLSLYDLENAANKLGMITEVIDTRIPNLKQRKGEFVCIALMKNSHYVILANLLDKKLKVIDVPMVTEMPIDTFEAEWTGYALLVSKVPIGEQNLVFSFRDLLLLLGLLIIGIVIVKAFMK